jgi:glycosyltransferase involved in cell wall biosynthesis
MKISIALATYNGEAYIWEQLNSLANQIYLPKELIVCDDGSADRTLYWVNMFAEIAPFPVHIYRNEKPLGLADNLLQAASLCKGDLIAFCDQDDVWLPEKLQYCLAMFIYVPELVLFSHNAWVSDEKLSKIKRLSSRKTCIYERGDFQPLVYPLMSFTQVFRKELVQDIPWNTGTGAEGSPRSKSPDSLIYRVAIMASSLGKVMVSDTVLAFYRQHGRDAIEWEQGNKVEIQEIGDRLPWASSLQVRNYLKLQRLYQEYADCLEKVSKNVAADHALLLSEASEQYRQVAMAFSNREALYEENLNIYKRVQRLTKLVGQRTYIHLHRSGLGIECFFKDLVCAIMAGRRTESAYLPPQSPTTGQNELDNERCFKIELLDTTLNQEQSKQPCIED